MFLDASVMVAILVKEPGHEHILARLEAHGGKLYTSPMARYETVVSIARAIAAGRGSAAPSAELLAEVEATVDGFLEALSATEVAISGAIGRAALEAASRYGEASGHPAGLGMGECFAYACAKAYRLTLVYKGDGFARTDLR